MTQKTGKFAAAGDALISVTVYKSNPKQKAGIKVIQKLNGGIYITAIAKGGLLDGTRVDVGDKLLSINGRRMRPGQDTRDFMKLISAANEKVTIVVKKDGADRQKKALKSQGKPNRIVEAEKFRAPDGSFDFNINPKLEEFTESLSKLDDKKDQTKIISQKLFPDQGAGLTFKKKDEKLFISGIALDSIFADTNLEFGDRIVAVMDVNMMNFADADYAKTLLKRAKDDVNIVVEKGWDILDKKVDMDRRHGLASENSIRMERKTGKVTIVKNEPMESLDESKAGESKPVDDGWRRTKEDAKEDGLTFSPESSFNNESKSQENSKTHKPAPARPKQSAPARSKAFVDMKNFERTPASTEPAIEDPMALETLTNNKSTPDKTSSPTPQHPIAKTFTPSPTKSYTPDKESPSPRKFLPPVNFQNKKNYRGDQPDAGDVVTRMLDRLDNERKAIKERHRIRLDRSFDESENGVPSSSEEGSPQKRPSKTTTPTRYNSSTRTYPGVKSSTTTNGSNKYHTPTSTGLTRNLRKHQHGYLCINVRKKSERSPGIKLRRKDDIFILDRLPHDETRIPVGVQVLAINGNDSFSTVVKANELIDSKRQEVELCVSFEGLIATWASGASGQ